MKQAIYEKEIELAKILNLQYVKRASRHCTGKWAGTIDYCMNFSNGPSLYISNGMKNYEKNLDYFINNFTYFYKEKNMLLKKLDDMSQKDNALARKFAFKTYQINDIDINKDDDMSYWPYISITVDNITIPMVETGLKFALLNPGEIDKYITENYTTQYYVAGGYSESQVDFIFHGVGFASDGGMYRINATKSKRV